MKELIIANPGTGKTTKIAKKYKELIERGIKSKDILCLTFTVKAKEEMEKRILKELKNIDTNVKTFHSFALDNLDEEIVDNNKLRYSIFKYLMKNKVFTYDKEYIIDNWVPKFENAIRYIKSFGILPKDINKNDVIKIMNEKNNNEKYKKEDLEFLINHFLNAYSEYEKTKKTDFNDVLIKYLKNPTKKFEWVLVDELQDVNNLEAEVALKSGKNIFAVGDAKQAIFGFQGGSIKNFEKFKGNVKTLSLNYRSKNNILKYAKAFYLKETENAQHKKELENFKSNLGEGEKIKIVEYETDVGKKIVSIINKNRDFLNKKIGIIVRTNSQIPEIAEALKNAGYDANISYETIPENAKEEIIQFIKGILSNKKEDIALGMLSTFSPVDIKKALKSNEKEEINDKFEKIRKKIKKWQDLIKFYDNWVIKTSLTYGKGFFDTAIGIKNALIEAKKEGISKLDDLVDYLKLYYYEEECESKSNINILTVHKAKGKDFDLVIYIPKETRNKNSIIDTIMESILESKKINVREELEEESLRIDFVALTRAKEKEFILVKGKNIGRYFIDGLSEKEIVKDANLGNSLPNMIKEVEKLVIYGDLKRAEELIKEEKDNWLKDKIIQFFKRKELNFSLLRLSAEEIMYKILNIPKEENPALNLGNEVHKIASKINSFKDLEKIDVDEKLKPYIENLKIFLKENDIKIKEKEVSISTNLKEIFPEFNEDIRVKGKIDVIYEKDGKIWIGDYKTSRSTNNSGNHKQQIYLYRKIFANKKGLDEEEISAALIYLGLNNGLNRGIYELKVEDKIRIRSGLKNKIKRYLNYRNNIGIFIEDLKKSKDPLIKKIILLYKKEEYGKKEKKPQMEIF